MAIQWLRLWHDMPNDPKWRTIARASHQPISSVLAVYLHILVAASNATERGRTQPNAEDIGSALDLESAQVAAIVDAMQGRVLDGDLVMGWDKRQVEREDGAAARAKAWREAKKEAERTQSNASERKRTPDKDKDKDKEEEKEKKETKSESPPALPDWLPIDSWTGYLEMRKKIKKVPTMRAVCLLIAKLEMLRNAGQDLVAVLDRSTMSNWTDVYAIKQDMQARASPVHGQLDLDAARKAATEEGRRRLFGNTTLETFDAQ